MGKTKKRERTNFDKFLKGQTKDRAFRKGFEEELNRLRIAHEIAELRKAEKLSQKEFAKKLKTTQSVVSRMEQGNQNFTLGSLEKIAKTFDKEVTVGFSQKSRT